MDSLNCQLAELSDRQACSYVKPAMSVLDDGGAHVFSRKAKNLRKKLLPTYPRIVWANRFRPSVFRVPVSSTSCLNVLPMGRGNPNPMLHPQGKHNMLTLYV